MPAKTIDEEHILRDLVKEVLMSEYLTEGDKTIVRVLGSKRLERGWTEPQIATELKLVNWNKEDGIIRTQVTRSRQNLRDHFRSQTGSKWGDYRLEITSGRRGPYRLILVPRVGTSAVARFWNAHFRGTGNNKTLLIFTEPLFFFNRANKYFIRYLDLNAETLEEAPALKDRRVKGLVACFHYQPSGEAGAVRTLAQLFKDAGHRVEPILSRKCEAEYPWRHDLVLLGNSRTNRFLREAQELKAFNLEVGDYAVKNRTPQKGEKRKYEDLSVEKGKSFTYALVTRCKGKIEEHTVTIVAANHGRAAERVGRYLTSEEFLGKGFEKMKVRPHEAVPEEFQILFAVETHGFGLAEGTPIPIVWRGIGRRPTSGRGSRRAASP